MYVVSLPSLKSLLESYWPDDMCSRMMDCQRANSIGIVLNFLLGTNIECVIMVMNLNNFPTILSRSGKLLLYFVCDGSRDMSVMFV